MGLAEPVEDVGFVEGVAEVDAQGERLLVVVEGLGVLAEPGLVVSPPG